MKARTAATRWTTDVRESLYSIAVDRIVISIGITILNSHAEERHYVYYSIDRLTRMKARTAVTRWKTDVRESLVS